MLHPPEEVDEQIDCANIVSTSPNQGTTSATTTAVSQPFKTTKAVRPASLVTSDRSPAGSKLFLWVKLMMVGFLYWPWPFVYCLMVYHKTKRLTRAGVCIGASIWLVLAVVQRKNWHSNELLGLRLIADMILCVFWLSGRERRATGNAGFYWGFWCWMCLPILIEVLILCFDSDKPFWSSQQIMKSTMSEEHAKRFVPSLWRNQSERGK